MRFSEKDVSVLSSIFFFWKTNLQSVRAKTPGHEVFFLLSIEYDSYVW